MASAYRVSDGAFALADTVLRSGFIPLVDPAGGLLVFSREAMLPANEALIRQVNEYRPAEELALAFALRIVDAVSARLIQSERITALCAQKEAQDVIRRAMSGRKSQLT